MSVGTVVTAFLLIASISFILIILGVGIEKIHDTNNDMINSGDPYTQDRKDMMEGMFNIQFALPAIFIFVIVFYAIIQAIIDKDTAI